MLPCINPGTRYSFDYNLVAFLANLADALTDLQAFKMRGLPLSTALPALRNLNDVPGKSVPTSRNEAAAVF
jgi:hypothetical protein